MVCCSLVCSVIFQNEKQNEKNRTSPAVLHDLIESIQGRNRINIAKPTTKVGSQDKTEIQKFESLILSSEGCQTYFQQKAPRDKKLLKILY